MKYDVWIGCLSHLTIRLILKNLKYMTHFYMAITLY